MRHAIRPPFEPDPVCTGVGTDGMDTHGSPLPFQTERLVLRTWRRGDRAPFAAMCADPCVMSHFPAPLTCAESDEFLERIGQHFDTYGFGFWAVEERASGWLAGLVGLAVVKLDVPFTPAIEIGWRLARRFWGRGYASEAARASLAYGFKRLKLKEIVSFTAAANHRLQRVMERIGMVRDPRGDFDHPGIEDGHPFQRHVLYRMSTNAFKQHRPIFEPAHSERSA